MYMSKCQLEDSVSCLIGVKSCSDSTGALSPRDSTPADSNLLSYDNLFLDQVWLDVLCVYYTNASLRFDLYASVQVWL